MASARKELKEIVKAAREQGWRVEIAKNGHLMFYAPDGKGKVLSAGTPGGGRAMQNSSRDSGALAFAGKGGRRE